MHVAQAGIGEPLVMLHGWPQHWYEFRHLIPVLHEWARSSASCSASTRRIGLSYMALGGAHLWPTAGPRAAWAFRRFWWGSWGR